MEVIEIIISKFSSINIFVFIGEDGDFVERFVFEQMKLRVVDGKFVIEIVEYLGQIEGRKKEGEFVNECFLNIKCMLVFFQLFYIVFVVL